MEHIPVLKDEIIDYLNIKKAGLYVDGTLGGGGHAEAVLKRLTDGHLYAFDQDAYAITKASARLSAYRDNLTVIHANFASMREALEARGVGKVDGIYLDLGVSSFHFDDPARGFSYRHEATLDMRMDQTQALTAKEIINTYDEKALRDIFHRYGEERFGGQIAKKIVRRREEKEIGTTFELVDVIKSVLPAKVLATKGHPAKRIFQALRIAVNDELGVLDEVIGEALSLLKDDGRLVIITFHSLEDRIVKNHFKNASTVDHPKELPTMPTETADFELLHKKVIRPSEDEIRRNPRAASAKLRAIRKCSKKS